MEEKDWAVMKRIDGKDAVVIVFLDTEDEAQEYAKTLPSLDGVFLCYYPTYKTVCEVHKQ